MFALFTPQILRIVGIALLVLALCGLVVGIHHSGYKEGIAAQQAVDQKQALQDMALAKQKTDELQHQLNEAQNALLKAQADLLALTTLNRNTVSKLRQQLDTYDSNLSNLSREALSHRVTILSGIVEECTVQLVEVARAGDASNDQVIMLEAAWPK